MYSVVRCCNIGLCPLARPVNQTVRYISLEIVLNKVEGNLETRQAFHLLVLLLKMSTLDSLGSVVVLNSEEPLCLGFRGSQPTTSSAVILFPLQVSFQVHTPHQVPAALLVPQQKTFSGQRRDEQERKLNKVWNGFPSEWDPTGGELRSPLLMFVRVRTSLEDENKFKLHILEPLEHRGKLISQSGPVCGYIPSVYFRLCTGDAAGPGTRDCAGRRGWRVIFKICLQWRLPRPAPSSWRSAPPGPQP